jgi:methylenetetrahydrofolate dehydrogenase (NAD+)
VRVLGVPSLKFRLPVEAIQPNSVVINFSLSKNIDEDALMKIVGIKYVAGIGKVTVAMLKRNLLRLYQYHIENRHRSQLISKL